MPWSPFFRRAAFLGNTIRLYGLKFHPILGTIRALLTPNVTKSTQNDTPLLAPSLHPYTNVHPLPLLPSRHFISLRLGPTLACPSSKIP